MAAIVYTATRVYLPTFRVGDIQMNDLQRVETERYYRTYQWIVVLSLAFAVCLSANFIMVALRDSAGPGGLIIVTLYLISIIVLKVRTSGARRWGRRDPLIQAVRRDEWSRITRSKAYGTAFAVTLWAQVPLGIFMDSVPPEPKPGGVAALTMTLGLAAFFGAYLYYARQPNDG